MAQLPPIGDIKPFQPVPHPDTLSPITDPPQTTPATKSTIPQLTTTLQPWYSHLTLDLLTHVLSRSVFHPAIILIFWLCLCGMHKHKSPLAFWTLYYAAFLAIVEMLVAGNHYLAYGAARKVQWEKEVVIVTGGAKGLGRVLVEVLLRKGVKVGVLDVVGKEEGEGVEELCEANDLVWERCDVGDLKAVEGSMGRIVEELGPPTMLILNAASTINGLPLLPAQTFTSSSPASPPSSQQHTLQGLPSHLAPSQASATFQTNAISHFNLLHALLPYLIPHTHKSGSNGATIVTISSILSHLYPAYLSDYAASKSAASSIHHSLTNEILSHPDARIRSKLKTLLIETGHMDTDLFNQLSLPAWTAFFAPMLNTHDVAKKIIDTLSAGRGGVVRMPFYAKIVGGPIWHLIPDGILRVVRGASGIDTAMVGRRGLTGERTEGMKKNR